MKKGPAVDLTPPSRVWRLYNSVTKEFYGNLSETEVGAKVLLIEQNKVAHWFVAEEEDVDWTPLYKGIHKFKLPNFENVKVPGQKKEQSRKPNLVESLKTRATGSKNADGSAFLQSIQLDLSERRHAPRYSERLKVVINMGLGSYETYTEDFSLSAIKVALKFRNQIQGDFEITLYTGVGPLQLYCSALVESGAAEWNRMKIVSGAGFSEYLHFLEGRVNSSRDFGPAAVR